MTNKLIHTNSVYFALAILMVFATRFLFIQTAFAMSSDFFDVIDISDVIVADQPQEGDKDNHLSEYVYLGGQELTDSEVYTLFEHSHSQKLIYSTGGREIEVQTSEISCADDDLLPLRIKITPGNSSKVSIKISDDALLLLDLVVLPCDSKKA